MSDFLRMDRFTHPRRETFRGHEVLVFDFEPNPSYKPATTVERLLHELVGAVWIDEQAQDVADGAILDDATVVKNLLNSPALPWPAAR